MLTFECCAKLETHLRDMQLPQKKHGESVHSGHWGQNIALEFLRALWLGKVQVIITEVAGGSL